MNHRYLITTIQWANQNFQALFFLDENRKLIEVHIKPAKEKAILGNIYLAKVQNVVPNINGAFMNITREKTCYYSFDKNDSRGKKLKAGDVIPVQVIKDAVKTKDPVVSSNLTLTGRYVVVTSEITKVSVSSKMNKEQARLKKEGFLQLLSEYNQKQEQESHLNFGVIIRTNASEASEQDIFREYVSLGQQLRSILSSAQNRTVFSLLYEEKNYFEKELEGITLSEDDKIITDDENVYKVLIDSGSFQENHIELYRDDYPIQKLYSLTSQIEEALSERVWLKSGANLIITPTEALTVIDVNSGKNIRGKNPDETFFKINLEAAIEIARQLRIRNISGICIIDFINMKSSDYEKQLLQHFRAELKKDRVTTTLVDITPLGLVEVTRKKTKKSLKEQLNNT